jgi:hypothetical protein
MGIVLTTTAGLCLWIILWATLGLSGLDAILIAIAMVLVATGVHNLWPFIPGRRRG